MSARARWIALRVALVVVLGLVALYWFKSRPSFGPVDVDEREPKTWVVQPSESLTLTADEVRPGNIYRCSDEAMGVNLEVEADGSATLYCTEF